MQKNCTYLILYNVEFYYNFYYKFYHLLFVYAANYITNKYHLYIYNAVFVMNPFGLALTWLGELLHI